MLVSNLLLAQELPVGTETVSAAQAMSLSTGVMREIEALLELYHDQHASMILIANEVGMGVVPAYPLGRLYRDVLGQVNMQLAAAADVVLLMVAGLAIDVKQGATTWETETLPRLLGEDT